MITLENISKTYLVPVRNAGVKQAISSFFKREYRHVHVFNQITLNIQDGEMVRYIGHNGAGKSTTIKILSGILYPEQGKVRINGLYPFKELKKHAQQIGVVYGQQSQSWWDLP